MHRSRTLFHTTLLIALVLSMMVLTACGAGTQPSTEEPSGTPTEEGTSGEAPATEAPDETVPAEEDTTEEEPAATEAPDEEAEAEEGETAAESDASGSKILRAGLDGSPNNLNPFISDWAYDSQSVIPMHCMMGRFTPELTIEPYLTTWEISDDGTTYTFHVHEDALWHDGEPVVAEDIAFTFRMVAHPDSGSVYFDKMSSVVGATAYREGEADDIEGLNVIDDKTLEVTLEEPNALFLATTQTYMMILPSHILGSVPMEDMADAPYWRDPIGCGPYQWVEYATNQYVHFEKFPDFFLGEPNIDEFYLSIGNTEVLQAAFETGNLDIVHVDTTEVDRFQQMPFAELQTVDGFVNNLILNTRKPFFDDVTFRQALMYGIDRQLMVDAAYQGYAAVAQNAFVTPWTLSPNITEYEYNPERARELLQEAGWDGSVQFELLQTIGDPEGERMNLILQQNLADIGITINIVPMEGGVIIEKMSEGDFDMGILGFGTMSLLPEGAINYLGSDAIPPSGSNLAWYDDAELTDLLVEAARTPDPDQRQELFYQITEITTDRLPLLPLVVQQDIVAINTDRVVPAIEIVPRNRPGASYQWLLWNLYEWDMK